MVQFNRRTLLLAGFAGGAVTAITAHYTQEQVLERTSVRPEESLGFDPEMELLAVRKHWQKTLTPVQPTIPYSRALSQFFIRCSRLGTEQYLYARQQANYEGEITPLASYTPAFQSYQQVASFRIAKEKARQQEIFASPWLYQGYILTAPEHHLVVYRGTQEIWEWIANVVVLQQEYDRQNIYMGRVHSGFYRVYEDTLAEQTRQQVGALSRDRPIYLIGHSLGGAIAILAAYDLALRFQDLRPLLQVYVSGTPRVGDPFFAKRYNQFVPNTFRVCNFADVVPILPPSQLRKDIYLHVGQEWGFVTALGDTQPNHLLDTYRAALDAGKEQLATG